MDATGIFTALMLIVIFVVIPIVGFRLGLKNRGNAERKRIKAAMYRGIYEQEMIDDVAREVAEEQRRRYGY